MGRPTAVTVKLAFFLATAGRLAGRLRFDLADFRTRRRRVD